MKILRFEELPSTNEYIKTLRPNGENAVVIARRQSAGRGTKGRSFSSFEGGVYLSKLTFYDDFPAKNAFLIMARAAVAVCKTLEDYSLAPVIKWANDVYVDGKKICGILIENVFSGGQISSSLVGVGLNVNNELPEELSSIATTLKEITGKDYPLSEVEEKLLGYLSEPFALSEYERRLGYLGVEISLISGERTERVIAIGVESDGGLLVRSPSGERKVYAGEVSLSVR